jgi:hypothetical protein
MGQNFQKIFVVKQKFQPTRSVDPSSSESQHVVYGISGKISSNGQLIFSKNTNTIKQDPGCQNTSKYSVFANGDSAVP